MKGNFNLIKLVKSLRQTPHLLNRVHIGLYFTFGNNGLSTFKKLKDKMCFALLIFTGVNIPF